MTKPSVSVCIPVYNREKYIGLTLESVFNQTFEDYEVIVVDDASTDNTVSVVKSYGDRVRLIRRTENSQTAEIPRYEAVSNARSEYCALLDSDDIWHKEKLEKQYALMVNHPAFAMSHSYVNVVEGVETRYIRHEGAIDAAETAIARQLLEHCFISTSSVMVKRSVWLQAQNPYELKTYGTEWDFFLAIARQYEVGFIAEPLVDYIRGPQGVSWVKWKRTPQDVGAIARIYRNQVWKGIVNPKEMRRIMQKQFVENTQYWLHHGYSMRSLYFCIKGIRLMPFERDLYVSLLKTIGHLLFGQREMLRRRTLEE